MAEHDQRFKTLLREFFPEFLQLFFPDLAARLDLSRPEWLDKELFPDPPHGEALVLDLVARVRRLPPPDASDQPAGDAVALVHVEVESREAVATFRRRMFQYYEILRRQNDVPVLPVAVYLRVGLNGIGIDVYTEEYEGLEILRFQYLYVGLPALDAERYVLGDNLLGVALSSLMRAPEARRAWLTAHAEHRILVQSEENPLRKHWLHECLNAYRVLDEEQQREYDQLKQTKPYQEIEPMAATIAEQLLARGREEGREEERRNVLRLQLEHRFGKLTGEVLQRLETLSPERVREVLLAFADAPSLKALGLED
jgi:hypothetical protein